MSTTHDGEIREDLIRLGGRPSSFRAVISLATQSLVDTIRNPGSVNNQSYDIFLCRLQAPKVLTFMMPFMGGYVTTASISYLYLTGHFKV